MSDLAACIAFICAAIVLSLLIYMSERVNIEAAKAGLEQRKVDGAILWVKPGGK